MSDCCKSDCCSQTTKPHTYEGCVVGEVKKGTAIRVSDRNGNEKQLKKKPCSLLYTTEEGEVILADGGEDKIYLSLQEGSAKSIVIGVDNGDGKVALHKVSYDGTGEAFAMIKDGEVKFVERPTLRAMFQDSEVPGSKNGKVALIDCAPDGKVRLVKFTGCGGDKDLPLVVDPFGNVTCKKVESCDDAVESAKFSAIMACHLVDDVNTQGLIKPETDTAEIAFCKESFHFVERGLTLHPSEPSVVWSVTGVVNDNTAVSLPAAPDPICEDGDVYALLLCNISAYRIHTYPSAVVKLFINDIFVTSTGTVIYQGTHGDTMFLAKLTKTKTFNVKFTTEFDPATNTINGSIKVMGYYR